MDIIKIKKILDKPVYIRKNNKDLSIFLNEISSLLKSGINLEEAIFILKDQREIKSLKYILNEVYEMLLKGYSLSYSFKNCGNFDEFFITMIRTGEETGRLQIISKDLSTYYKRIDMVDKKIKGAMIYPLILLTTAIFVLIFIFNYVMPTFIDLFRDSENTLPKSTRVLISVVEFFHLNGNYILIGFVAIIFFSMFFYKKTKLKYYVHRSFFKIPLIGKNYSKILTAKISMALFISINSGINFLYSLKIISGGIGNRYLEEEIHKGILKIENGKSISDTFQDIRVFPKLFSSMLEVGERTGELSDILKVISNHYVEESDYAIENILRLFEPFIIIVMAIIIGFIVISIATPMFDLINNYSY
ncbi:MAG: type II secretion system F family protein [Lagierella massiliensis]|nr:type II secretion system F family protein [Lagierella massiliensis]